MLIDLSFNHYYDVREQKEMEPSDPCFSFGSSPHENAQKLLVAPQVGRHWSAVLGPEYEVPPAVTGVFATPSPTHVCIVSGGGGYVISVVGPSHYRRVSCFPITAVVPATRVSRLIFADFTHLAAWDSNGEAWRTSRVSLDGIKILRFDDKTLFCRGWNLEEFDFEVDLASGYVKGGVTILIDRPPI